VIVPVPTPEYVRVPLTVVLVELTKIYGVTVIVFPLTDPVALENE
jgi:hypothetical protein